MDVVAEVATGAPSGPVHELVADLATYPEWLEIVRSAEPAVAADDDVGPAWSVVLQARIGPLRRSKRLRMVRVTNTPTEVRFLRHELDGRSHSEWRLEALIAESTDSPDGAATGCRLTMRLHYGGALWIPVLDRLLAEEIERSRPRLIARLSR